MSLRACPAPRRRSAPRISESASTRLAPFRPSVFKGSGISCNAKMDAAQTKKFCRPTPEGMILLERVFEKLELSARAYDKILRIARTVADLDGSETVNSDHISQAVQYRSLDRTLWRNVK